MNVNTLPIDNKVRLGVLNANKSFIVSAAAGSGKTTLIEGRIMACLLHSNAPEEVLAITFTNAAAAEIRTRIIKLLECSTPADLKYSKSEDTKELTKALAAQVIKHDAKMNWNLVKNPSRLRIMTFDAFANMTAEDLPILSGQFYQGKVIEDPYAVYREAVIDVFEQLDDDEAPNDLKASLEVLFEYSNYRLENIIPYFSELLSKRDQWIGIGGNLNYQDIVDAVNVYKHSILNQLSPIATSEETAKLIPTLNFMSGFEEPLAWANNLDLSLLESGDIKAWKGLANIVLTQKNTFRKKLNKSNGFPAGSEHGEVANKFLSLVRNSTSESHWVALDSLVSSSDLEEDRALLESIFVVLRYLAAYLAVEFREHGVKDFLQVALTAQEAIGNNEIGFGDALLREDSLRHIIVDETQDTSISQFNLLSLLTQEWADYNELNPTAVKTLYLSGDAQQSIYRFRNAEPSIFTDLSNNLSFNGIDLKHETLSVNFRSSKDTVEFINEVGATVFPKVGNAITGDAAFVKSYAHNQLLEGGVQLYCYPEHDKKAEASAISIRAKHLLTSNPEGKIAILTTTRKQVNCVISELLANDIPVAGSDIDAIANRPSVKMAVVLIKALWHEAHDVSWLALLKSKLVGLSWNDAAALSQYRLENKTTFLKAMKDLDLIEGISEDGVIRLRYLETKISFAKNCPSIGQDLLRCSRYMWGELKGDAFVDASQRTDIRRVFDALRTVSSAGRLTSLEAFDRKLSRSFAAASGDSRITVMTIHKSKGLEFDHVILTGLGHAQPSGTKPLLDFLRIGSTLIPAPQPKDERSGLYGFVRNISKQQSLNERKRLFYVAATRQKQTLDIFAPVTVSPDSVVKTTSNTMIHSVWAALEKAIANAIHVTPTDIIDSHIANASSGVPEVTTVPAASNFALAPAADVTSETEKDDLNHTEFNLVEAWRAIEGLMIRKIIEQCISEKPNWISSFVEKQGKGLRAQMIKNGYPSAYIDQGLERVIANASALLQNKEVALHMIRAHELGLSDQRFSMAKYGRFINRRLDMVYHYDNTLVAINFALERREGTESDETLNTRIVETHTQKLSEYHDILASCYPDMKIDSYVLAIESGMVIKLETLKRPAVA